MKVLKKMGERLCEGEKHKNDYLRMKQTLRKTSVELESGIARRDYEQRLRHYSSEDITDLPYSKSGAYRIISVFLHSEYLDHHNLSTA